MSPKAILSSWAPLIGSMALLRCGGSEMAAPIVVPRLSAEESILQVSSQYGTSSDARRLLAPPSELAIHQRRIEAKLLLHPPGRREQLRVAERYEYRNGRVVECVAEVSRPLQATYEFVHGEPTAKLTAAQVDLAFRCTGPTPAELSGVLPASATELVLRDESLVVIAPAADRRRFLPVE